MTDRLTIALVAILGLVLVSVLVILGRDARRSAERGPRWKRRLVEAGLVCLALLGVAGCGKDRAPQGGGATAGPPPVVASGGELSQTPQWKHLTGAWREAEEVASGKRGDYPFDEAGKKKLLADLAAAGKGVEALRAAGSLIDAEAGLLQKDLALLTSGVQEKRPTEMRMATCYEPMAYTMPVEGSMARLSERLPLLEELAVGETLRPEVIEKVLATVERDVATIGRKDLVDQLPEDQRAKAVEIHDKAQTLLDGIHARLKQGAAAPPPSPELTLVAGPWKPEPDEAAGRDNYYAAYQEKLGKVRAAAKKLAASGRLSSEERGLLEQEVQRAEIEIKIATTCYDTAGMPPAKESLQRLSARLPILKKLAAEGRLHPVALTRVLDSIAQDARTLSDEKMLSALSGDEKARAAEVRAGVEALLAEIKKSSGDAK
jgi:hypothetical protein